MAGIAGLYLCLLAVAAIYISTQKDSIRKKIEAELNEKLHGDLRIGGLDISLWRYFPSVGLRLNDFSLSDSIYRKPILAAKTMATTFNPFGLIISGKKIDDIIIEDAAFHLFTDSTGYTNKYLLSLRKENTGNAVSGKSLEIEKLKIRNLSLLVEDAVKNKRISLLINDLKASIRQEGPMMSLGINEAISMREGLGFNLEKGYYFGNQQINGSWQLELNRQTNELSFERTKLSINDHPFYVSGRFLFTDNPHFALRFDTKEVSYSQVKAIVTQHVREKISKIDMDGPLDAKGAVEGSLMYRAKPYVNIDLKTKNNDLKTHVAAFSRCSFTGNFMNRVDTGSVNDDANSRISFSSFESNWGGIDLKGRNIVLTNLVNPILQFELDSECKLQSLDELFAMKQLRFLEGTAKLRLSYNGPVTKDKSMLEELEGKLSVANGTVEYVPRGFTFTKCNGNIEFYKDSISVPGFHCNYQKNDIRVRMHGKNIRRSYLVGDHSRQPELKCELQSTYLDLEDFKTLFAAKKQRVKATGSKQGFDALSRKFDGLINNGVIHILVKVDDIRHQNLRAKNFDGDIRFGTGFWDIPGLSLNLSGGMIRLTGKLVEKAGNRHQAGIKVNVNNVDIKKLFFAFDDFGLKDISHMNLQGSFSTAATLLAGIDGSGMLEPSSLSGAVDFSLKNGGLQNFAPLEQVKNYVFKKRNLSDVRFAEVKTRIDLNGENMYINRMEVESNVFRLFVEGNYGLNGRNTDLLIQVPFSNFNKNSFDDTDVPVNRGIKKAPKNIWLRAKNNEQGRVKLTLILNPGLKNKKPVVGKK